MRRCGGLDTTPWIAGIVALSLAVFPFAGCDRETRIDPAPPPPEIPEPDLEALDPAVRQLLIQARQKLDATRAETSASPADLATSFGDLGRLFHAHSFA